MRILARTLVILAAALIVAGGTFALGQSGYAQTQLPGRPSRSVGAQASSAQTTMSNDSTAFVEHEHEGSRSPSLFGAVEVFQNLAIISLIVAIVSFVKCKWRRRPNTPPALRLSV